MALKSKNPPLTLQEGATYLGNKRTRFRVWAPSQASLAVEVIGKGVFPLQRDEKGFFEGVLEGIEPGECYYYLFANGAKRPDPVSRALPHGVEGPTQVVDPAAFHFTDGAWKGYPLRELIFYELHVGTFSPQGTFAGVIERLDYLVELGINCVELMPVASFAGRWNWGYDGTSLYAPYAGYGGEEGLKELVNACHAKRLAVCLDVVYNHSGPQGNFLPEFAPYFSQAYQTPWGETFNYDGPFSDQVRHYIFQNALYWLEEYHIDLLRLDAIHGIYDFSAVHLLQELASHVERWGHEHARTVFVVAESDRGDARIVAPLTQGGWNLEGFWNEDFHHALHVTLTGEKQGYYQDFQGVADLYKLLKRGAVYDGVYSTYREKRQGNSFATTPFEKGIAYIQNHDQIGNRPDGERLTTRVSREALKVAACMTLLSPCVPLLFMGEEYGEKAPFAYFVDYPEKLMEAIFEGRKKELESRRVLFPGQEAFESSRLRWQIDPELFTFYKTLIALRKEHRPTPGLLPGQIEVYKEEKWIAWEYPSEKGEWIGIFCSFSQEPLLCPLPFQHTKNELVWATQPLPPQREKLWKISTWTGMVVK